MQRTWGTAIPIRPLETRANTSFVLSLFKPQRLQYCGLDGIVKILNENFQFPLQSEFVAVITVDNGLQYCSLVKQECSKSA